MPNRPPARQVTLSPTRSQAIGERLRTARQAAHLTQEALAHASGVAAIHVQRIERGLANPTAATLYALGDALELHPAVFLP